MRTKLFAFVIFFLWLVLASQILSEATVFAQYVDTAWVRRYNAPRNLSDYAKAIAVDGSGNVYVTGYNDSLRIMSDYATIKYHPNGDTAWVRRYDGPVNFDDQAYAIAVDDSGNVYVTGHSDGDGTGLDYATIKYKSNGDTAWVRRYNGPGNDGDEAYAIAVDDSGNVYVTGVSFGGGTGYDYATIKYKSNGDTAWVRRYNSSGDSYDEARAIAIDNSGNVYVTGSSGTIKYDAGGNQLWMTPWGGVDIALDDFVNVYLTGTSYDPETYANYATIKCHPNGDTAWVRRYNGPEDFWDEAYAIAVDSSGNVYVTGNSAGSGGDSSDYATIKYDASGNEVWVQRYIGDGYSDLAYAIAVDGSGNVYVTGLTNYELTSGTHADYATIKYYPNGNTAWVKSYNGPAYQEDGAYAIAVDGSNNVYVTGASVGSGTYDDYATIKYIQYDSIPFTPAVNYEAGNGSEFVFCSDLDGDGDLDLAVANVNGNNISILKNNGNGTFQPKVDYGVGSNPVSLFCADLDGDGDLDLAVANLNTQNVSILKNDGNGTFQPKVDYSTGDNPTSVFCADLDGDTDLDLAVANRSKDSVSILKNVGDGSFQARVGYRVGNEPHGVFCADLDGDNDLDLAVANDYSNNVSILKNNGDGTFQPKVDYGTGESYSVFCADLDGDNDLDLVVSNRDADTVFILKNNGDGTFQPKVGYSTAGHSRFVFSADLDGDGDLDLAVANPYRDNISILKNNGDGTFQTNVDYGVGEYPNCVFCADLDGDGDQDLAVANYNSDNISILKNLTQVPANQPPKPFSLISPPDQDTIFGSIMFRWQTPYDPNFGDQIRYDLYVSTVPGFDPESTIVYDSLPLSRLTDSLNVDRYYWKVKAYDNWGAERWSTQTWSFEVSYLTDGLTIVAFSPVDLIVTDPIGDSIGLDFNTIPDADYDTTTDYNHDGDKDDIVTIPNRLVGDYLIEVVVEPGGGGVYSLGIRIDGSDVAMLATNQPCPSSGEVDTFSYNAPLYLRGDANGDWKINIADVVYLINYLFAHGSAPEPLETGDANCSNGVVNSADVVYLINYLFAHGSPPGC
jgi:hypothetical protein